MDQLVKAVREFAAEHYNEDGWDIITESFTDPELLNLIGNARTVHQAISRVRSMARVMDSRRCDIQSEIF